MSNTIEAANALKTRLAKAASVINEPCPGLELPKGYNEAIVELEDIILDFKTLSHSTDKEAPINAEILAIPGNYRKRTEYYMTEEYLGRIEYLIDKFIQYNSYE